MLFYSGGAGTVRGQAYQSLGVDLSPGVTIGGRAFMAFSGELRANVAKSIQAVTFADTGYVAQDALGTGQGEWHSGAGIGGRYMTGVGPIRVDLATPLDGDAGKKFELYIGIGQAF
jgi:translocation and assembly module TamA